MEEKGSVKIVDKIIDFMFSKDNRKWIILIMILGLILRVWIVPNIAPVVADEMVHGPHAIGVIGSGVLNMQNESPVWFYLTDIFYEIFGVNSFSMRALAIFFGVLLIPLIYMVSKKIFRENGERIGLIAGFLWAISSFVIRYSLGEMDIAMIFFVMMGIHFFMKDIEKKKLSLLVFVFMGIAVLVKPIALTFIPGFFIYFFVVMYREKDVDERKKILKENSKNIIYGILIFLVFMSPVLVYNYLLYSEKGITDVLFSRFFGISPEIYQGLQGADEGFMISKLINYSPGFLKSTFLFLDPLISIIGLIGLLFILFSKNKIAKLFIGFWIIPFIFLLGSSPLQTHFVMFMIPLSMGCGYLINKFVSFDNRKMIGILLVVFFVVSMYLLMPYLFSKSAMFKARSFISKNVGEDDIIVLDARIYRGRIVFLANDKHYIELSYFPDALNTLSEYPATKNVRLYFIECLNDDCGWGTIGSQPDFNQSMEEMGDYIKSNSQKIDTYLSGGNEGNAKNGEPYFDIYVSDIGVNSQMYSVIDSTHQWFYYPVGWKGDRYDSYQLDYFYKKVMHKLAYLVLWLAILIAILSPILLLIEVFKKRKF